MTRLSTGCWVHRYIPWACGLVSLVAPLGHVLHLLASHYSCFLPEVRVWAPGDSNFTQYSLGVCFVDSSVASRLSLATSTLLYFPQVRLRRLGWVLITQTLRDALTHIVWEEPALRIGGNLRAEGRICAKCSQWMWPTRVYVVGFQ